MMTIDAVCGQHAADPALAVDGHDHRLVERLDKQCRQVFRRAVCAGCRIGLS